ncbi:hypothetical protein [Novibacillus thermophilus]|nr:hypothetical protein [Novibacillus thermophilus]
MEKRIQQAHIRGANEQLFGCINLALDNIPFIREGVDYFQIAL